MKRCIYCYEDKEESQFTLEHIFPQALGGNLCGTYFETDRVCTKCNSELGIFVDGAFIKGWFSKNYDADAAKEYIDLKNASPLPFIYMGVLNNISIPEDRICEVWLGPCGDHVYHIHSKDEDRFSSYAGGNVIARKRDPGDAFLFLTTKNQQWIPIILNSFRYHFKHSRRYSGNLKISDQKKHRHFFDTITQDKADLLHTLEQVSKTKTLNISLTFQLNIEKRFICKLAIGVGYKLLGEDYLNTSYCKELRNALWGIGKDDDQEYKVRGSGSLFDKIGPAGELVAWMGGHSIATLFNKNYLGLMVVFFGVMHLNLMISDEPSLWVNSLPMEDEGQVIIIVPQIKRSVGPISLGSYLAHRYSDEYEDPQLSELEALRIPKSSLPPCR